MAKLSVPALLLVLAVSCAGPPESAPVAALVAISPPYVPAELSPLRLRPGLSGEPLKAARQRRYELEASLARARREAAGRHLRTVVERLEAALAQLEWDALHFDEADKRRWQTELRRMLARAQRDRQVQQAEEEQRQLRWILNYDLPTPIVETPSPDTGAQLLPGAPARAAPELAGVRPLAEMKRATAPEGMVRLLVDDQPLPLTGLRCWIRIDGARARVLQALRYRSASPGAREGTVQLRLPPGGSPFLVALGGASRAATAAVEDAAAALTAEPLSAPTTLLAGAQLAIVSARQPTAYASPVRRRQIGLAPQPWVGRDVLRLRVHPITPSAETRLLIGYDVDLVAHTRDGTCELSIALPAGGDLDRRVLEVSQSAACAPATVTLADDEPLAVTISGGRRRWTAPLRGNALRIRVPLDGRPLVAQDAAAGPVFAACVRPAVGPAPATAHTRRAVFVVDASHTARASLAAQLSLLERTLVESEGSLRRFRVLRHDITAGWWRADWSANDATARAALARWAGSLAPRGASDPGAAFAALAAVERPCSLVVLGAGHGTWDGPRPELSVGALPPALQRLIVIDHADGRCPLVRMLERDGATVLPASSARTPDALSSALRRRRWRIRAAQIEGQHTLLLDARELTPGQLLRLVGRGRPASSSKLTLELVAGETSRRLVVPLGQPLASPLAIRAYGEQATRAIEARLGRSELSIAYARYFRVPGRSASLRMPASDRKDRDPPDRALIARRAVPPLSPSQRDALCRIARQLLPPSSSRWIDRAPAPALLPAATRLLQRAQRVPATTATDVWTHADQLVATGKAAEALSLVSGPLTTASIPEARRAERRRLAYQLMAWNQPAEAARLLLQVVASGPPTAADLLALGWAEEASGKPLRAVLAYQLAQAADDSLTTDLARLLPPLALSYPSLQAPAGRALGSGSAPTQAQIVWSHRASDLSIAFRGGDPARDTLGPGPEVAELPADQAPTRVVVDHYASPGARLGRFEEAALVSVMRGGKRQLTLLRLIPTRGVDRHLIELDE